MKYLVLLIMLFSLEVSAMETIKIELKNHNNNLILSLINVSQEDILINKRFLLGSSVDPCEVELVIMDKNGNNFPFCVRINVEPITDEDLVLLKPGEFIEEEYKIGSLIYYYELPVGHYKVKAIYKNKYWIEKGVFDGLLTSDFVNIEVYGNNMGRS